MSFFWAFKSGLHSLSLHSRQFCHCLKRCISVTPWEHVPVSLNPYINVVIIRLLILNSYLMKIAFSWHLFRVSLWVRYKTKYVPPTVALYYIMLSLLVSPEDLYDVYVIGGHQPSWFYEALTYHLSSFTTVFLSTQSNSSAWNGCVSTRVGSDSILHQSLRNALLRRESERKCLSLYFDSLGVDMDAQVSWHSAIP